MIEIKKKHDYDEVFDSQIIYRKLLKAFANPLTIENIKTSADKINENNNVMLAIAMTLLDNEVSYSVAGEDTFADNIAFMTLANKTSFEEADFIFINEYSNMEQIFAQAKSGTLRDPHKSATIIIDNAAYVFGQAIFKGPGIDGQINADISQTIERAVALRDGRYDEYPLGIDLVFASANGDVCVIPRLVKKEVC